MDITRISFIVAIALLTASPSAQTPAVSRIETGEEWLARCGTADAAGCVAWVEGLVDINEIYRGLGALEGTTEGFCMPDSASVTQAFEAVRGYMARHPDARRFSARMVAYMALRQAFPCTTAR